MAEIWWRAALVIGGIGAAWYALSFAKATFEVGLDLIKASRGRHTTKVEDARRREEAARRHQECIEKIEPVQRKPGTDRYPLDWEWRRAVAYLRANAHCERCGKRVGAISTNVSLMWNEPMDRIYVRGGHVHHRVPLAAGGDHSLDNLIYICPECHLDAHPNMLGLESENQEGADRVVLCHLREEYLSRRTILRRDVGPRVYALLRTISL